MLSDIKRNIINWYPFKKNSTVLEIGVEIGEVTKELCLKNEKVVSVKLKKDATEYNYSKDNLEVFSCRLENIKLEEKFDYVVLIGTLDKAEEILQDENAELILLKYAKEHLKDDGKILIACDNKLGIDKSSVLNDGKYKLSKSILNNMFKTLDLDNKKYYYVLPNYRTPNVIFTDDYLPNEESITRNFTLYSDKEIVFSEQVKRYRDLIQENREYFKDFANSFFIELSQNKIQDNDIKFVSFSNIRKSEYRIKTIINSKYVTKEAVDEKSSKHIESTKNNINIMQNSNIKTIDSYDDEKIISQFQNNVNTLDKVILEKFQNNDIKEGIKQIRDFMQFIITNFEKSDSEKNVFDKYNISYTKDQIQNLHFIKNGLWDLIFQNCFYINNEYYFYDQEWYEENIPVEFIIYRAILYCTSLNKYVSNEELYNNIGIDAANLRVFRILDDALQRNIRDNDIWNIHCSQNTIEKVTNMAKGKVQEYERLLYDLRAEKIALQNEILNKNHEIKYKEEIIKEKDDIINGIYNSGTWKMTEPLRKLKKIIKNKKGSI